MGQIKFMVGMAMVAMFAISIVGYTTNFATENTVAVDIGDNSELVNLKDTSETNLISFASEANGSLDALFKGSLQQADTALATGSSFKTINEKKTTINIITEGFRGIFGNNTEFGVLLTTLVSLILIISGLYLYKTWVGKNPN